MCSFHSISCLNNSPQNVCLFLGNSSLPPQHVDLMGWVNAKGKELLMTGKENTGNIQAKSL